MARAAAKSSKPAWLTYRGTSVANRLFFLPEQVMDLQDAYLHEILVDVTHVARDERRRRGAPWCEMSMVAAQCAAAMCVDGLFLECHPEPEHALSDSNTQISINYLADFLGEVQWPM
jgi:3-deoxy-D-manno-octulosonic acid (KDO) 8-phosphate synthase